MSNEQNPQIHCVIEDDGVIYYSARLGPGHWTREAVSRDGYITITDSHHPSLGVEGRVVHVVWDGVLDNYRNICWCHRTYTDEGSFWSWIWPVCNTANPSTHPVLTTGFFLFLG